MTLILGGSGQLGTAFRKLLPDAVAPTRRELDLADIAMLEQAIDTINPSRIINCAAYTAVDAAEDDPEVAELINGEAVGVLAGVSDRRGIPFVSFSTDYVFDGETDDAYTESSQPKPLNVYGESKLLGERIALEYPGTLIIRSSWFMSATHHNFVSAILAGAGEQPMSVVDDQWGRPTPVNDLARATLQANQDGMTGLLHLASPPATTWFELAQTACDLAGIALDRIVACSADEYQRRARRPRYAVLESERGYSLPDWRQRLPAIVSALLDRSHGSGEHASIRSQIEQ